MFRLITNIGLLVTLIVLPQDLLAQESMATIGRGSSNQDAANIEDATLDNSFGANTSNSDVDPAAASAGTNAGWDGFGAPINDFSGTNEETDLGFGDAQIDNMPVEEPIAAPAKVIPVRPSSTSPRTVTPSALATPAAAFCASHAELFGSRNDSDTYASDDAAAGS
jgi:hypothetical protein